MRFILLFCVAIAPLQSFAGVYEAEINCLRDVNSQHSASGLNRQFSFPFGANSYYATEGNAVYTELYKASGWYKQYGSSFYLADGDKLLYGIEPPYNDSGFSISCNTSDGDYTLIEIDGKQYTIHDGFVAGSILDAQDANLPLSSAAQCVFKLGQAQALAYAKLAPQLTARGTTIIQVLVEQNKAITPVNEVGTDADGLALRQDFEKQLAYDFSSLVQPSFDYNLAVRALIAQNNNNRVAPSVDTFFNSEVPESCQNIPLFQSYLDSEKTQIQKCADNIQDLYEDCEQ